MNQKILIVDDSLTVRMDLDEALSASDFTVVHSGDLATARRALRENNFALVILDVLLPDGDGIELLREIKANEATAHVPIMLLSAEAEVRDRVRGLRTGADEYIGKPYDLHYLVARARELLRLTDSAIFPRSAPLILMIDDSPTFRAEIRAALIDGGFLVETAESGEEGLRIASLIRPEAIIVDGQLPGIDGVTVVRRLRSDATFRRTPCLLLTASESEGDELRSLDAGVDMFVRKSEEKELILARLATMLRSVAPAAPAVKEALFGPKKILAVDDSLTFLEEVTSVLSEEQYEVIQAHSAEEALQLLEVQLVDCILLDLVMPGMSGEEACRKIKSTPEWSNIPVVILTARTDLDGVLGCLSAGADDYVPKASDFDLLKARVRGQLRRKQYEGENRFIHEVATMLRKNEAMLRAMFECAPDAILVADKNEKVVRVNERLEAMFGYKREELLGKSTELLIPTKLHGEQWIDPAEERENSNHESNTFRLEVDVCRKDGSQFPVEILCSTVRTDDGILLLAIIRDITDRKQAEESIRKHAAELLVTNKELAQKNQENELFVYSVSHDLRSPLVNLQGFSNELAFCCNEIRDIVAKDPTFVGGPQILRILEDDVSKSLHYISAAVTRLSLIIDALLRLSRAGRVQLLSHQVPLQPILQRIIDSMQATIADRSVDVSIGALPTVYGDPTAIEQILANLVGNALNYLDAGRNGKIEIGVQEIPETAETAHRFATIFVRDNGLGIPKEYSHKIFQPFQRLHGPVATGEGMGLALVRRFVDRMGGFISFESAPGVGSTFFVTLPIVPLNPSFPGGTN